MAIYHLEAKVVSRGNGRSAVAASAYLSCSKMLNGYPLPSKLLLTVAERSITIVKSNFLKNKKILQ